MYFPNNNFEKSNQSILRAIALTANLLGYGFLLWVDWRIAVGIFFLFFATNIRLQMKDRELKEKIIDYFFSEFHK